MSLHPASPRTWCHALGFALGTVAVSSALAQTAPPLKPGLWEMKSPNVAEGGRQVDVAAHMKSLPPEARKQVEALMKQKGIDIGAGDGSMKVCLDRASLDRGRWQGTEGGRCKTDFTTQTSSIWKWRSVCTSPASETEGEAAFASDERYTVKTVTRASGASGQAQSVQASIDAKWLGADCGTLKPMSQDTLKAPATAPSK